MSIEPHTDKPKLIGKLFKKGKIKGIHFDIYLDLEHHEEEIEKQ